MKTITQSEYYQLLGLLELAKRHNRALDDIVAAACAITGELRKDGAPETGGHTSDMLYSPETRSLDDTLRRLDVQVLREDTP